MQFSCFYVPFIMLQIQPFHLAAPKLHNDFFIRSLHVLQAEEAKAVFVIWCYRGRKRAGSLLWLFLCSNQVSESTRRGPVQTDCKVSHCANQDFSGCMKIAKLLWHAWNWPMHKQAMGNCGVSVLNVPWGGGQMLDWFIIWPLSHSYSMALCARRAKHTKTVVYFQTIA